MIRNCVYTLGLCEALRMGNLCCKKKGGYDLTISPEAVKESHRLTSPPTYSPKKTSNTGFENQSFSNGLQTEQNDRNGKTESKTETETPTRANGNAVEETVKNESVQNGAVNIQSVQNLDGAEETKTEETNEETEKSQVTKNDADSNAKPMGRDEGTTGKIRFVYIILQEGLCLWVCLFVYCHLYTLLVLALGERCILSL